MATCMHLRLIDGLLAASHLAYKEIMYKMAAISAAKRTSNVSEFESQRLRTGRSNITRQSDR